MVSRLCLRSYQMSFVWIARVHTALVWGTGDKQEQLPPAEIMREDRLTWACDRIREIGRALPEAQQQVARELAHWADSVYLSFAALPSDFAAALAHSSAARQGW